MSRPDRTQGGPAECLACDRSSVHWCTSSTTQGPASLTDHPLVSGGYGAPVSEARACGNIWIWVVICAQTGRTGESAQCPREGGPVSAHLPWRKRLTGQKHGGTLSVMIVLDGLRGFRSATALKNTRAKPRQTASKMKEFIGVWSRGEEKRESHRSGHLSRHGICTTTTRSGNLSK